jgi:hypothetical protein
MVSPTCSCSRTNVVFASDTLDALADSVRELATIEWNLFYLGGHPWGTPFLDVSGCPHLKIPTLLTCTHAIAYHSSAYDRVLSGVPASPSEVALWLRTEAGIDQYYDRSEWLKYVAHPVVASQPNLLSQERNAFRDFMDI